MGQVGQTGHVGKVGMLVFLATDAMGFGGLLIAYAVLRTRAASWPDPATRFDRPLAGALTFVLLLSGATITAAVTAAREGKRTTARALIALTALGGVAFVTGQAAEFHALARTRHLGLTADHAAALFYVITGYHSLHVLIGVLVLVGVTLRCFGAPPTGQTARIDTVKDRSDAANILEVASLYWQFVDLVWIVIFTALYLLPPVMHG
jgi:cytochrome c oxidase subunit 3